jgi:DNA polymerase-3 subunit gamma/tau
MEYRALYRKYRPQRFSEIIGQSHVTGTLSAEVRAGRVAHAYLFAGPRGTGKTTTARIIAKAMNCERIGDDGEPCNDCSSCLAITEGTSFDVIELDAASHNKVEDVREIRVNVGTVAAAAGSRRVYILDEAHMLSRAASNALLKTLEEPPEHAHFVLATTEPYKLPDTIRSRAQRFDFHPIGSEVLAAHLDDVGRREGYSLDGDAVALIVRHARGSARDALGLLEQVAALGSGSVDVAGVTQALGMADTDAFGRLVETVAAGDAPGALTLVSEIASSGADLRRFVADALEFFRGLFLAQYAPNLEEIVDEPDEVLAQWRSHARTLSAGDVLRCIDQLGDALGALREGREERLVVELALLRLTRPETATDAASLAARLERLEDRVRRLQAGPPPEVRAAPETVEVPGPDPEEPPARRRAASEETDEPPARRREASEETGEDAVEPVEAREGDSASPVDLAAVDRAWPALIQAVREEAGVRRHALFGEARPGAVEGDLVVLEVPASMPFHLDQLTEDVVLRHIVETAAARILGTTVRVEFRLAEPSDEATGAESRAIERAPDKDALDASGEGTIDPVALAEEMLGAKRVEE